MGERHIGLLYRFLIFLHIWGFKKGSGTKGRWWKDYRGLVLVFQFQFPFFHLFYVYYVVHFNFLCVSVSDMCCKKIIFVVFFYESVNEERFVHEEIQVTLYAK